MTPKLRIQVQQAAEFVGDIDTILTHVVYENTSPTVRLATKIVSDVTYWPAFAYSVYADASYGLMALTLPLIFKFAFRRQRPFVASKDVLYRGAGTVYPGADAYSFPSGHAWMVAALAFHYPPFLVTLFIGVPWVILVCCTRVATGSHYLGDVIVGVLGGVGQAAGFVHPSHEWPVVLVATALWAYTMYQEKWIVAKTAGTHKSPVQVSG